MRVLIWGLGYVGAVSAACLARQGHHVTAVEPNEIKVDSFNQGRVLLREPRLRELVRDGWKGGCLRAVGHGSQLIREADVSLVCVGTPSQPSGAIDLSQLRTVMHDIGAGLKDASAYHVVNLRSTVFPGTSRRHLIPILEKASGKHLGQFGFVVNPEFLREGSGVSDFEDPPFTIIGATENRAASVVAELYSHLAAPVRQLGLEAAEMVKLTNNAFHSLKVGFSNEVGRLCEVLNIDSHQVMDLVSQDTKLNLSPAYLSPGFAFGGPCLGKDLRALLSDAKRLGVNLPILSSILPSNSLQIDAAREKLRETGANRVGILGLSFKPGTDDLRESPVLELVRRLVDEGREVEAYDPDLAAGDLIGANLDSVDLGWLSKILSSSPRDLLRWSEVVVVAQKRDEFAHLLTQADRGLPVIDLVRIVDEPDCLDLENYMGLSW